MNFDLEQFAGYFAAAITGGAVAYIKKIFKDLNASFTKMRDLENRVLKLEKELRHGQEGRSESGS